MKKYTSFIMAALFLARGLEVLELHPTSTAGKVELLLAIFFLLHVIYLSLKARTS